MQTSSEVHAREAYLPREPSSDVERYRLPSIRAFAIEWARQARLARDRGLAVDDATLERVADAVLAPGSPPPWQPFTAEERRGGLPGHLWDAVQGYLAAHPDIDAGVEVQWRDGKQTLVVGIVGDPGPHRARLARIAGSRVVVERRSPRPAHTAAELDAVAERISADKPELTRDGLHVAWLDWPVGGVVEEWPPGCVEVHVAGGHDERAVADEFAARYGDAVSVRWLGPRRAVEGLRPFGSWTSGGRWLRVFFGLDPNGEEPGEARVAEESDERIVIALSSFEAARLITTLIGGFHPRHADVELREPVGERVVIDASAGVVRPSLAQLGVPAGPPLRLHRVPRRDSTAPIRRRAQVWFTATDDNDAVYEAMLPTDPPRDKYGDPVVMPAVRRDVLDAICREITDSSFAWHQRLSLTWEDDVLILKRHAAADHAFAPAPGPDGLYDVGRLGAWREVDPPLPEGPIDADTAVDLLSRVRKRSPTQELIIGRLDLDVLGAALTRATNEAIRDALDDEIAKRARGLPPMLFRMYLRNLERNASDYRGIDASYMTDFLAVAGRDEILALVPDARERILALARAERDGQAAAALASALERLGHRPPSRS